MATAILRPNGDFTVHWWTPEPGADNYTTVNEVALYDDDPVVVDTTDYVHANADYTEDRYTLGPISGVAKVTALKLWVYHRQAGAGVNGVEAAILGTDFEVTGSWLTCASNESWQWGYVEATGLDLSQGQINGAMIGLRAHPAAGSEVRVACAYIKVTYSTGCPLPLISRPVILGV
jgi:hypothetical protein